MEPEDRFLIIFIVCLITVTFGLQLYGTMEAKREILKALEVKTMLDKDYIQEKKIDLNDDSDDGFWVIYRGEERHVIDKKALFDFLKTFRKTGK